MRDSKLSNLDKIGILATVVGLFNIGAAMTGIRFLNDLGSTFGISPAPDPYTRVGTADPNSKTGPVFGCEDSKGNIEWHRFNHTVRGALPGPHRRTVVSLNYFNLRFRLQNPIENGRFAFMTHYYFCNNGPMAQATQCPADTRAVAFKTIDPVTGKEHNQARISCTL